MGWMSWERFRCETNCAAFPDACIDENLYRNMTERLAADGYLMAGYNMINIDDCWMADARDADGVQIPNATRFPSGMKYMGDFMHSRGIRFGLYTDEGTETCGGYPGSQGYEEVDAATFAEWGAGTPRLSHHRIDAFPQRDPYNMAERSSPLLCSQTLPS